MRSSGQGLQVIKKLMSTARKQKYINLSFDSILLSQQYTAYLQKCTGTDEQNYRNAFLYLLRSAVMPKICQQLKLADFNWQSVIFSQGTQELPKLDTFFTIYLSLLTCVIKLLSAIQNLPLSEQTKALAVLPIFFKSEALETFHRIKKRLSAAREHSQRQAIRSERDVYILQQIQLLRLPESSYAIIEKKYSQDLSAGRQQSIPRGGYASPRSEDSCSFNSSMPSSQLGSPPSESMSRQLSDQCLYWRDLSTKLNNLLPDRGVLVLDRDPIKTEFELLRNRKRYIAVKGAGGYRLFFLNKKHTRDEIEISFDSEIIVQMRAIGGLIPNKTCVDDGVLRTVNSKLIDHEAFLVKPNFSADSILNQLRRNALTPKQATFTYSQFLSEGIKWLDGKLHQLDEYCLQVNDSTRNLRGSVKANVERETDWQVIDIAAGELRTRAMKGAQSAATPAAEQSASEAAYWQEHLATLKDQLANLKRQNSALREQIKLHEKQQQDHAQMAKEKDDLDTLRKKLIADQSEIAQERVALAKSAAEMDGEVRARVVAETAWGRLERVFLQLLTSQQGIICGEERADRIEALQLPGNLRCIVDDLAQKTVMTSDAIVNMMIVQFFVPRIIDHRIAGHAQAGQEFHRSNFCRVLQQCFGVLPQELRASQDPRIEEVMAKDHILPQVQLRRVVALRPDQLFSHFKAVYKGQKEAAYRERLEADRRQRQEADQAIEDDHSIQMPERKRMREPLLAQQGEWLIAIMSDEFADQLSAQPRPLKFDQDTPCLIGFMHYYALYKKLCDAVNVYRDLYTNYSNRTPVSLRHNHGSSGRRRAEAEALAIHDAAKLNERQFWHEFGNAVAQMRDAGHKLSYNLGHFIFVLIVNVRLDSAIAKIIGKAKSRVGRRQKTRGAFHAHSWNTVLAAYWLAVYNMKRNPFDPMEIEKISQLKHDGQEGQPQLGEHVDIDDLLFIKHLRGLSATRAKQSTCGTICRLYKASSLWGSIALERRNGKLRARESFSNTLLQQYSREQHPDPQFNVK